jgi:tetratricopeptide (TPR) repeat protein
MKTYFQNIRARVLLLVGGVLIFVTFVFLFFFESQWVIQGDIAYKLQKASNFEKGQYYFNNGDTPSGAYDLVKAQYFYEKAILKDPKDNPYAWYQSGRIDFINGDFDSALEKFSKQIEYFGDTVANVYYMVGLTYGYKARATNSPEDWKQAEDNFKKSISFLYEAPWPYVDLAWVYFSVLEKGLTYEANNPWLLNMYGLALLNTGNRAMAREYFIFAGELAAKVTVEEWGRSYSGNNPATWGLGLTEFRTLIAKNIALTQSQ